MSAENKHEIIDRLNRTGRFKNWQPDPDRKFIPTPLGDGTPTIRRLGGLGGPPVPGAFDPANPTFTFTNKVTVAARELFAGAPTRLLYIYRDILDEILASRPDSKR